MGPAVSWLCAMGMMPARLTRPSVGLMPTRPVAFEGHTIEPSVSVPMAAAPGWPPPPCPSPSWTRRGCGRARRGCGTARRGPTSRTRTCRADVGPLAHVGLAQQDRRPPRAGARRRCCRARGIEPSSASEPAVVVIRSCVSTLSLRRIGMPCSGPARPLRAPLRVERVRDGQRVRVRLQHAAQRRPLAVHALDAVQVRLGERARREPALGHGRLQRVDPGLLDLEGARRRPGAAARERRPRSGDAGGAHAEETTARSGRSRFVPWRRNVCQAAASAATDTPSDRKEKGAGPEPDALQGKRPARPYWIENSISSTGTSMHSPAGKRNVAIRVDHWPAALNSPSTRTCSRSTVHVQRGVVAVAGAAVGGGARDDRPARPPWCRGFVGQPAGVAHPREDGGLETL